MKKKKNKKREKEKKERERRREKCVGLQSYGRYAGEKQRNIEK